MHWNPVPTFARSPLTSISWRSDQMRRSSLNSSAPIDWSSPNYSASSFVAPERAWPAQQVDGGAVDSFAQVGVDVKAWIDSIAWPRADAFGSRNCFRPRPKSRNLFDSVTPVTASVRPLDNIVI